MFISGLYTRASYGYRDIQARSNTLLFVQVTPKRIYFQRKLKIDLLSDHYSFSITVVYRVAEKQRTYPPLPTLTLTKTLTVYYKTCFHSVHGNAL